MFKVNAQLLMVGIISLSSTFVSKADAAAAALPAECSTTLIQYRGNYQINDLDAQIRSAKNYRKSVEAKRTKEDKSNLARIDKRIVALQKSYDDMNALQLNCMQINPVYSPYVMPYNPSEGGGSYEYGGSYTDGGSTGGDGGGSGGM